ncbi:Rho GTPase-activating protein [Zostera marina]|uniref:Rho GTPase-activating protein n=1 Tax=Zostera marina TaxID=29655 RepID=A0A0K9PZI3_ZOSMR|nr:Rho GTPase-activating protein [Zostera marina]
MAKVVALSNGCRGGGRQESGCGHGRSSGRDQVSVIELVMAALRKSIVACRVYGGEEDVISNAVHQKMEIGYPTDVKHVTHVTFDRFNGFLGLPVELEVEIPTPVPSASASVFGVSPESMQCGYDSRGNSVPSILLLMQDRLYDQNGLMAEGIFRINPENSREEYVMEQLNNGIVPDDIDVHCLAGLIKAWFRELPIGILDGISPEEVVKCNDDDDDFLKLIKVLEPTQAALLNWAVELMADVVQEEQFNKMNARNIAMVFAPNMTQMSDPLTALMHAVQVMNLLKSLILKKLHERSQFLEEEDGCSDDEVDDEDDGCSYDDEDDICSKGSCYNDVNSPSSSENSECNDNKCNGSDGDDDYSSNSDIDDDIPMRGENLKFYLVEWKDDDDDEEEMKN